MTFLQFFKRNINSRFTKYKNFNNENSEYKIEYKLGTIKFNCINSITTDEF